MTASFKNKNKANRIENNCDEFVDMLQETKGAAKGDSKEMRPARFEQQAE